MRKVMGLFKMLRNNRGETNPSSGEEETPAEEENPSIEDLVEDELGKENPGEETPKADDEEGTDKPKEEETPGEKPTEKQKDDDPEIDLGIEENGEKVKMKLSELKQNVAWLRQNSQSIGASMRIRELAGKHPEFGNLLTNVISKSFNDKDEFDSDFVNKTLGLLEKKAEIIDEKIEEKDDDIEELEALLDELDEDSSQAITIKKNIKILKQQKKTLQDQAKSIDELTSKVDGISKANEEATKKKEEENADKENKRLRGLFNDECTELIKDMSFINDKEKQQFLSTVRNTIASQSVKIENDEQFKKIIGESVKAAYQKLEEYRQSLITQYLKSKGKLPPEQKKEDEETPADIDMTPESLENEIQRQLSESDTT